MAARKPSLGKTRSSELELALPTAALQTWLIRGRPVKQHLNGVVTDVFLSWNQIACVLRLESLADDEAGQKAKGTHINGHDISQILLHHEVTDFKENFGSVEHPKRCAKIVALETICLEFQSERDALKWINGMSDALSSMLDRAKDAVEYAAATVCRTDKEIVRHSLLRGEKVTRFTMDGSTAGMVYFEPPPKGEEDFWGKLCFCIDEAREKRLEVDFGDISDIFVGKQVAQFQTPAAEHAEAECCMSMATDPSAPDQGAGLHVEFESADILQRALKAIADVLNGGGAFIMSAEDCDTDASVDGTSTHETPGTPPTGQPLGLRVSNTEADGPSSYVREMVQGVPVSWLSMAGAQDATISLEQPQPEDQGGTTQAARFQLTLPYMDKPSATVVLNTLQEVRVGDDAKDELVDLGATDKGVGSVVFVTPPPLAATRRSTSPLHSTSKKILAASVRTAVQFTSRDTLELWLSGMGELMKNGLRTNTEHSFMHTGENIQQFTEEGVQDVFLYYNSPSPYEPHCMGKFCVCKRGSRVPYEVFRLKDVSDIFVGRQTREFFNNPKDTTPDERCMSLQGEPGFALHLAFGSEETLQRWLRAVANVLNGGGATIVAGGESKGANGEASDDDGNSLVPLRVRSPIGHTLAIVDASNQETVLCAKQRISVLVLLGPVEDLRLLYAGQDLEDTRTLEYYQIPESDRSVVLVTTAPEPKDKVAVQTSSTGLELDDVTAQLLGGAGSVAELVPKDQVAPVTAETPPSQKKPKPKKGKDKKPIGSQRKEEYDEEKESKKSWCFCS